jgi:hypothetical protein
VKGIELLVKSVMFKRWKVSVLTSAVALLILTGCNSGQLENNSNLKLSELIDRGCRNLPNLSKIMEDTRPASEPGRISRESFGELARIDIKYVQISAAFQKVDDAIDPLETAYDEILLINGFCEGIGSLYP